MEHLVEELKKLVRFKDTTAVGDIVLIASLEPKMLAYALVTEIVRDKTKRDEWWHVTMHLLAVPPQPMTWTLRTEQLAGLEIFTMNGEKRFVKAVDFGLASPKKPEGERKAFPKKALLRVVK